MDPPDTALRTHWTGLSRRTVLRIEAFTMFAGIIQGQTGSHGSASRPF